MVVGLRGLDIDRELIYYFFKLGGLGDLFLIFWFLNINICKDGLGMVDVVVKLFWI